MADVYYISIGDRRTVDHHGEPNQVFDEWVRLILVDGKDDVDTWVVHLARGFEGYRSEGVWTRDSANNTVGIYDAIPGNQLAKLLPRRWPLKQFEEGKAQLKKGVVSNGQTEGIFYVNKIE